MRSTTPFITFLSTLSLLYAGSATAAIVTATYTGTVVNGVDNTGEFGIVGADLSGLSYVSVFRFDTNLGVRTTVAGHLDSVIGGPLYGTTSPVLSASLTIRGITFAFGSDLYSRAQASGDPAYGYMNGEVESYLNSGGVFRDNFLGEYVSDTNAPDSLTTSYVGHPFGFNAALSTASFNIQEQGGVGGSRSASANMTADAVTIVAERQGPGVPEPNTWALLLTGFGVTGAALRGRRSRAAL